MHDIAVHAGPQYEIVCLRSTNSESQERLFTQIKQTSLRATNRKVEYVLPTVLLSLQAKQKVTVGKTSCMSGQESMVSAVAKYLPMYPGTTIDKDFVHRRSQSWQAHLRRISPYLTHGEGVWWSQDNNVYRFHDSDLHPHNHSEGPPLNHFHNTSLSDLHKSKSEMWHTIITSSINLPTKGVHIYSSDGKLIRERHYPLSDNGMCASTTHFPYCASDATCTTPSSNEAMTVNASGIQTCANSRDTPHRSSPHGLKPMTLFTSTSPYAGQQNTAIESATPEKSYM